MLVRVLPQRDRRRRSGHGVYAPLVLLLAAGAGLRVVAMAVYSPAVLHNPDSVRYLDAAHTEPGLFADPFAPGGYPAFLRLVRLLSDDVAVTIALQHALGLLTAALLYLTARRLGAPRWLSLLPAAAVALGGDQLYVEHTLLSEPLFTALVSGGLYAAARALDDPHRRSWLALAGGVLAGAVLVRNVGAALIPALAGWALLAPASDLRARLASVAAATAPAVAVLGGYAALAAWQGGVTGLTEQTGWSLYARTAPVADCASFDPPPGTASLCERTPAVKRAGGSFYLWNARSPARRALGFPPRGDERLGAFARSVILNQPLPYLWMVGKDVSRYVVPEAGFQRPLSGGGGGTLSFARRSEDVERRVEAELERFYDPFVLEPNMRGVRLLEAHQLAFRLDGWPLLAALVLALLGAALGRGRPRAGAALLALCGLALLVVPVATFQFTARFGVPAAGLVAGAAALGGWALAGRLRRPAEGGGPPAAQPAAQATFSSAGDSSSPIRSRTASSRSR